MNEMLGKNKQLLKLSILEEKYYNFLVNPEKKIHEPFKELYQLGIIDNKNFQKFMKMGGCEKFC